MDTLENTDIRLDIYEEGTSMKDIIKAKLSDTSCREVDDAFYLVDLGTVVSQYNKWKELLPRVQPFYAIKSNADPALLKLLAKLGTGFDCGSKREIMTALGLNASPSNIVYAHPCKQESYLKFARQKGISLMTFDNEDELLKIKRAYPEARLALRIGTDDSTSLAQLSLKYGCDPDEASYLLKVAKKMDLNVVGVSFHVGSGVQDPEGFGKPIRDARLVFNEATDLGFNMNVLDIGGGFPGDWLESKTATFEKIAKVINRELELHFPATTNSHVRIISEPGRYFSGRAFTLVVNVIARRNVSNRKAKTNDESFASQAPDFWYYLNDGRYGSFLIAIEKPIRIVPTLLKERDPEEPKYLSTVWGHTLDVADCLMKDSLLPKLEVGEWIYFEAFGAYTLCFASNFDGFNTPPCLYIAPKELKSFLQDIYVNASGS